METAKFGHDLTKQSVLLFVPLPCFSRTSNAGNLKVSFNQLTQCFYTDLSKEEKRQKMARNRILSLACLPFHHARVFDDPGLAGFPRRRTPAFRPHRQRQITMAESKSAASGFGRGFGHVLHPPVRGRKRCFKIAWRHGANSNPRRQFGGRS